MPHEHRALANALVLASAESVQDRPVSHRRPQRRSAQLARVAGLGVAACVLCGSVTLAAVITHNRELTAAAPANQKLEITGEQALLPDSYATVARRQPAPVKPKVPNQVRDTATGSFPFTPSSTTSAPPTTSTSRHAEANDSMQLVRDFYQLIASDPAQAFTLLAPEALNADLGRFVQAWSAVTDVQVLEMHEQKDGSVVTVVSMRMADGSHLRLEQLLRTGGDDVLRIVGAQLLSAQHG